MHPFPMPHQQMHPFPMQHQQQHPSTSMVNQMQHVNPNGQSNYPTFAQQVGCGTYGIVSRVYDPRFGPLALKTMDHLFTNMTTCKQAFREIKLLANLENENILFLRDILIPENPTSFSKIHLLTEIMETDLYKLIAFSKNIHQDHVYIFMYQLMRGLKYLHSAKIIHRDIKPANLLVNQNCMLKICDFGLAKYVGDHHNKNLSMNVVTHYYKAPELLMGGNSYSFGVDIWAAGCVFFELLCGKILFEVEDTTSNVPQLEKIIEILGTPNETDLKNAPEGAKNHIRNSIPIQKGRFDSLLIYDPTRFLFADPQAREVIYGMLQFNPEVRWSAESTLKHPYFQFGRHLFHTSESEMCDCCKLVNNVMISNNVPEPTCPPEMRQYLEGEFRDKTLYDMRNDIYRFIIELKRPVRKMKISPKGDFFTILPE